MAPRSRRRKGRRVTPILEGAVEEITAEPVEHADARLTGGDVDADWRTAEAGGEEAVGGSVSTPDQDVVDELGEALGVPQEPDAEVRTAGEILAERDRHRWRQEDGGDPRLARKRR
ncbi:MAG TPA: DUF6335 family protein [Candidatus Limnocylindria bacterium]|nr:DUF6335 family protein [Candidatus Limnocylindria bacterium]